MKRSESVQRRRNLLFASVVTVVIAVAEVAAETEAETEADVVVSLFLKPFSDDSLLQCPWEKRLEDVMEVYKNERE